jgi:hypothetical protein
MQVDAVKSRAELKTFIHLPFRLYRQAPAAAALAPTLPGPFVAA